MHTCVLFRPTHWRQCQTRQPISPLTPQCLLSCKQRSLLWSWRLHASTWLSPAPQSFAPWRAQLPSHHFWAKPRSLIASSRKSGMIDGSRSKAQVCGKPCFRCYLGCVSLLFKKFAESLPSTVTSAGHVPGGEQHSNYSNKYGSEWHNSGQLQSGSTEWRVSSSLAWPLGSTRLHFPASRSDDLSAPAPRCRLRPGTPNVHWLTRADAPGFATKERSVRRPSGTGPATGSRYDLAFRRQAAAGSTSHWETTPQDPVTLALLHSSRANASSVSRSVLQLGLNWNESEKLANPTRYGFASQCVSLARIMYVSEHRSHELALLKSMKKSTLRLLHTQTWRLTIAV